MLAKHFKKMPKSSTSFRPGCSPGPGRKRTGNTYRRFSLAPEVAQALLALPAVKGDEQALKHLIDQVLRSYSGLPTTDDIWLIKRGAPSEL